MNENLAEIQQWYKKDPSLLVAEKAAMAKAFPNFVLEQIGDGRLAWTGTLTPGIWKGFWAKNDSDRQTWEVMAVYQKNHPQKQIGSSVKVFLLYPTLDIVIKQIGWTPRHLLYDPISNQKYLCTAHAEDVKIGETNTSAATVLLWTQKWLTAFELVMTGDLSKEDFQGKGLWGVAQMVATAENGISQMYKRGLKQMENAKTKVEYLQAADIFQSLFNSLDACINTSSVDKNKCLEQAKKCLALAEQCKDDDSKDQTLENNNNESDSVNSEKKKVNADEFCQAMKKNLTEIEQFYNCLKLAEQGDVEAQVNVGGMCFNGKGIGRNYQEAYKWYMKAAEQGHAIAQNNLGAIYFLGLGVLKNYEEAFKWYKKAAEQGHAEAQHHLGDMYFKGQGVQQNLAEAKIWLKKAADQGFTDAQNLLKKIEADEENDNAGEVTHGNADKQ